jgi:alpha 1,3-glucosidase
MGIISGFVPMPPLPVLGFHFSKWAPVSADIIMERNRLFTEHEYPVDVLWMDIEWAKQNGKLSDYEYFKFNPKNFT